MHVPSGRGSSLGIAARTKGDTYSPRHQGTSRDSNKKSFQFNRRECNPLATRTTMTRAGRAAGAGRAGATATRDIHAGSCRPYAGPIWTPSTFARTP
ncbi:MAG: hypothetical protein RL689_471 [Planctomycetota bacterium]|jgi:hypothetical protein